MGLIFNVAHTQWLKVCLSVSLPSEPGLASVYWSKGWCDNCSYMVDRAKLQSNHHHQQTNIQFFTGRMPFLLPNQQWVSKHWTENITLHGLAYLKLTCGLPTLSLTINSSWLPWGRFAMPLISPLIPVPPFKTYIEFVKNFNFTRQTQSLSLEVKDFHVYPSAMTTGRTLYPDQFAPQKPDKVLFSSVCPSDQFATGCEFWSWWSLFG